MTTRALTKEEIKTLERQNCTAADWTTVRVHEAFHPLNTVTNTMFSGDVALGAYVGDIALKGRPFFPTGVHGCRLHNTTVGSNCRIAHTVISDTDIGDDCWISHTAFIGPADAAAGAASCGEGARVHCLAEDGARSIPLWRGLSSQWAHLLTHFKNAPVGRRLEELIEEDIADRAAARSNRCRIAQGCRIEHAGMLEDIDLGSYTEIIRVARLVSCTTVSEQSAPVRLGEGVSAEFCVFLPTASVRGGTRLLHCLVGEGVRLDNTFSAKHSAFFANSEFTMGEAAYAMAGPFAVSHHKATLILTCQASFNTFGSAANSSNHHFKLGPRHGGILRRGARCGSSSYLFWPSDIGAFTTVVGRHVKHLDTRAFPFSLLTSGGEKSVLVPGVNLFSSGVFRDESKWPKRDARSGLERPRDLYHTRANSPYTMAAVEEGLGVLRRHREATRQGEQDVHLAHGGAVIPASRIGAGIVLYESALTFFLGEQLLLHSAGSPHGRPTIADIAATIEKADVGEPEPWRDWGGMLVSGERAREVAERIGEGEFRDADAVDALFREVHASYSDDAALWTGNRWRKYYGAPSAENILSFLEKWIEVVVYGYERQLKDVGKEYSEDVMLGFGVEESAREAFRRVRGAPTEDLFFKRIKTRRDSLLALAYNAMESG